MFGGDGGAVEVDETFIGNDRAIKPKGEKKGRGYHHKHKVLSLVDRARGTVIATYASGRGPFGVAFDGRNIWVANFGSSSLSTTLPQ